MRRWGARAAGLRREFAAACAAGALAPPGFDASDAACLQIDA
jgi:hypothetical protein